MPTEAIKEGTFISPQLMMTHDPQAHKITLIDVDDESRFTLCSYKEAQAVANQILQWVSERERIGG